MLVLLEVVIYASFLIPWFQYYKLFKFKPLPNNTNYHLDNHRSLAIIFLSLNIIIDAVILYHHFKGCTLSPDSCMGHAFESTFFYFLKLLFLLFAEIQYYKFKRLYDNLRQEHAITHEK